jgi:hypothetical protein
MTELWIFRFVAVGPIAQQEFRLTGIPSEKDYSGCGRMSRLLPALPRSTMKQDSMGK